ELGQRLNKWLTAHVKALKNATPDMPLEDRAADTWEPMIAIADLAGGQWPRAARKAAVALTSDRDAGDEASIPTRLLADCRTAFQDADALPTQLLLDRLRSDTEGPWATLGANGLTAMKMGNLLRDFEIRSDTIRFPTGQAKGYVRSDFADAWNRYCPAPKAEVGEAVPAVPAVTSQVSPEEASPTGTAQAVPTNQASLTLTCENEAGTTGTAWGPRAVAPLSDDAHQNRSTSGAA
ncbi:MAG TPA: DUF3631 domain-containing protein, partial [Kribbella sp.]|uniref:DUF3631 domain-containing protein n=1 Tax=Kribbella sp. TaxID=1871183 RepID=UPI002D78D525